MSKTSFMLLLIVFGTLGVLIRYQSDLWFKPQDPLGFPVHTFLVNSVGSLLAGIVFSLTQGEKITPELSQAILVGGLGGLTTFSAFSVQTVQLLQAGLLGKAVFYSISSVACGIIGVGLGLKIT